MFQHTMTFLLATVVWVNASAQVARDSELFRQLKTQDSLFFERSFNQCDLQYLEQAIHKDLVFYHDKGGMQNKAVFLEGMYKNICSDTVRKPIRKPIVESFEVYAMYNGDVLYGAVQMGKHQFYIREKGKDDILTGTAKFIHLYLWIDNKWILKEVISYDHL